MTAAVKRRRRNPLRGDPTRTATLRRKFIADVDGRFKIIKRNLRRLILDDDAFGLVRNVFCPTGPGGGVDPTCSPRLSTSRVYHGTSQRIANKILDEGLKRGNVADPARLPSVFFTSSKEDARQYGFMMTGGGVEGFAIVEIDLPTALRDRAVVDEMDSEMLVIGKNSFRLEDDIPPSAVVALHFYPADRSQPRVIRNPRYGVQNRSGDIVFAVILTSEEGNTENVFCPTGPGEGVDPTCSPSNGEQSFYPTPSWDSVRGSVEAPTKNLSVNERFLFPTTAQKVEAFRRWLKKQMILYIIGDEEKAADDWWQRYVAEGYRQGAGRAFDDARTPYAAGYASEGRVNDFYLGTKEEFLRSSFGQPVAVEKVKLLAGRVYTDLKGITESMSTKLVRTLTDGLVQGKNPRAIAKDIDDTIEGIERPRARMIARTEIIRAHAEGQLDAFENLGVTEVGVAAEWLTAEDEKVCEMCSALEGVVMKVDEARGLLPRHPNAVFEGSTFSSYGECLEAVRAKYDGPCVVLYASGGGKQRTTIGPNHPIMTTRGMVRAAELYEGDKVLYDLRNDLKTVHSADLQEVPTTEDVFESFLSAGCHSYVASPGADLHGDRVACYGEVEAVAPARGLLVVRQLNGIEKLREDLLLWPDADLKTVAGPCPGSDSLWRVLLPPPGGMGSSAPWVLADDHFVWLRLDRVEFGTFTGYAFDYTTESSLYCSDGFVVSNCRCAWIPANVGEDDEDQKRSKREVEDAIDESIEAEIPESKKEERDLDDQREITSWPGADAEVDRERPESVLNRSWFAECPRDEKGRCFPSGSPRVASEKQVRAARMKSYEKFLAAPVPAPREVKLAHKKMDAIGADDYEMQIRGNSRDRAASRKKLLREFGDGKTCPCVYCGLKLTEKTVTRDKIYTARQGGRYRHDNLVPACLPCNQSRGDTDWRDIKL